MPNNIRRRFPGSQLRGVTPDVHRRLLTPAQPALILRCLDAAPLQGVGVDVQAVLPAFGGNLCEILPRRFRLSRQDRLLNVCQSFLIAQLGATPELRVGRFATRSSSARAAASSCFRFGWAALNLSRAALRLSRLRSARPAGPMPWRIRMA